MKTNKGVSVERNDINKQFITLGDTDFHTPSTRARWQQLLWDADVSEARRATTTAWNSQCQRPQRTRPSASSGIIGRSDFKSSAYGKPVCRMQGAARAWATRSGPGGGVYPAARGTNVPVTWQACVGLGGFLISCALP